MWGAKPKEHQLSCSKHLEGVLSGHLVVVAPNMYLEDLLWSLQSTGLPSHLQESQILYLSLHRDYNQNLVDQYPQLIYYYCQYLDLKALQGAAIGDCGHLVILATYDNHSQVQDTLTLTLLTLLHTHYPWVTYSLELVDENSLYHLPAGPRTPFGLNTPPTGLPYNYCPQFYQSDILLTSSLDYLLAHSCQCPYLLLILSKLIESCK